MKHNNYLPLITGRPSSGGIVTALVTLLFLISLVTAATITFLLWQNGKLPMTKPSTTAESAVTNANDPLLPQFTLDPSLEQYRDQINQKLWQPLREYYATRDQRLTSLVITSSNDEEHQIEANLKLTATDGSTQTYTFFYDPNEDNNLPAWSPSLLDNTN